MLLIGSPFMKGAEATGPNKKVFGKNVKLVNGLEIKPKDLKGLLELKIGLVKNPLFSKTILRIVHLKEIKLKRKGSLHSLPKKLRNTSSEG